MAVKLSSLTLPKKIPKWVTLNAYLFSSAASSCAISYHPNQEPHQTHNDFESKIQFLRSKLHPDTLISVLDTTPDLNSSLKLFKWASLQKKFHHTADTYCKMILKLGMAGNLEEMEGFCNEMVRDKCSCFEKSLVVLIDSFVSDHKLTEALRVLYVINSTSFKPSIGVFNGLMRALVEERRDFKEVLFVYKEMVKAGIFPNVETLNCLLEALFEAGKVDTAIDQYKRMGKKGCSPNVRTFEILISGLVSKKRVEESIVVLDEMVGFGCEVDSSFCSRVIPLFCGLRNLDIALRLFEMMRASDVALDSVVYGDMISCLCEFLRVDDAIKLVEEMVDSSLVPDDQVYLDIINGLCKLDRLTEARKFLEDRNVIDTSPYNALLQAYCDGGNFVIAKDMFDEMLEGNITDARSWNTLIRCLCENDLMNKALEYLGRMVVNSLIPDSDTYSALVVGKCKIGKIGHALGIFKHIRSKGWILDSTSYGELVECLCQNGSIREAAKVFHYMSGKDCALRSNSFSNLIEKMCVSGGANSAIKLFYLARNIGTSSLGATYNSILRGLSKSDHKSYIFVILTQMIVDGCAFDVETYCILIQGMSALNRVGDCISLFNLMLREELRPDSETLASLFSCLAKDSQMHLILSSVDKLASKSEILDSTAYNILIDSLWREGYKDEASLFLDLMLEKGWIPEASTHALLMGSNEREEIPSKKSADENFCTQDGVSFILAEELGKT